MITKVSILPGCISCGTCQALCPKVFRVVGTSQVISTDYTDEAAITLAETSCPARVIQVERDGVVTASGVVRAITATLTGRRDLTSDVSEFIFHMPGITALPGQFVTLQFRDAMGEFSRAYSLVSCGDDTGTLCIKLNAAGRAGSILRALTVSSAVTMLPPAGHFVLQHTALPKVFIATGTGLAPIMAMLQALPAGVPSIVLFGVRSRADLFYLDRLQQYSSAQVRVILSRPDADWQGLTGYVTDHLSDISHDAEVYICGNPDMVAGVRTRLAEVQHDATRIFAEEFTPQGAPPSSAGAVLKCSPLVLVNILLLWTAAIVPFVWYFFDQLHTQLWDISWIAVTLLMCIRPLADILPQYPMLRRLLPWRQGLGVLSAAVVMSNATATYIVNPSLLVSASTWDIQSVSILGHVAEVAGLLLIITSNRFSQKHLGAWWKRVQWLSYVYFFAAGVYLFSFGKVSALLGMVLVAVLWVAAALMRQLRTVQHPAKVG